MRARCGAAAVLVVVVCTQPGCLPHVLHGPRIHDGVTGGVSLTLGRNYEFDDPAVRVTPSLYAGARVARVPQDGAGFAASIGLQVPALAVPLLLDPDVGWAGLAATSYVDVYVQPARRAEPGLEYGIGALASTALIAPYVQAGMLRPGGSGWYTTQMIGFTGEDFNDAFFYIPTVVWRLVEGTRRTAANFSFGTGIALQPNAATDIIMILGATFELGLRDR